MSEYASGLTMGRCATYDKERVRHALRGELMCGEDEHGFVYESAPREECEAYILGVVDNWYFQAKRLADSDRAMERICRRHGWVMDLGEYMREVQAAASEHDDYVYEHEWDELHEEIRSIEEGDR